MDPEVLRALFFGQGLELQNLQDLAPCAYAAISQELKRSSSNCFGDRHPTTEWNRRVLQRPSMQSITRLRVP